MQAGKYFLNHYIYIYIYIMVFMITKKFILIFIYFLDENKSKYRILNPIIQKLNYQRLSEFKPGDNTPSFQANDTMPIKLLFFKKLNRGLHGR